MGRVGGKFTAAGQPFDINDSAGRGRLYPEKWAFGPQTQEMPSRGTDPSGFGFHEYLVAFLS